MKKRAILFFVMPFLFLIACSDNKMDEVVAPEASSYTSSDYMFVDIADVIDGIDNATIDNEMTFNPVLSNYSFLGSSVHSNGLGNKMTFGNPMLRGNQWLDGLLQRKHFGRIFQQLNLTETQRTEVNAIIKTFHDSMKTYVGQFRETNKSIIQEANTLRRAILERLRNNEITRIEAQKEIKELNLQTKEKIMNNPESAEIKDQMCGLRTQLLAGIESVLTEEQKIKWNNWLSNFNNPC